MAFTNIPLNTQHLDVKFKDILRVSRDASKQLTVSNYNAFSPPSMLLPLERLGDAVVAAEERRGEVGRGELALAGGTGVVDCLAAQGVRLFQRALERFAGATVGKLGE